MDLPSPPVSNAPLRRRNGRRQACEQCRRRKVACDHTLPTCSRCRNAGKPGECTYIISKHTIRSKDLPQPSLATSTAAVSGQNSATDVLSSQSPETQGTGAVTSPGYLGFTSFSGVYQETRNSLSLNGAQVQDAETGQSTGLVSTVPDLSPRTLEQCLAVLRRIPTPANGRDLFEKHVNPCSAWIRLADRRVLEDFYRIFGHYLGEERDSVELTKLARILCNNTSRPHKDDEPDADKWLASFSGANMRWENLGILFTFWSLGSVASPAHRPEPKDRMAEKSKTRAMVEFKECAELCAELSRKGPYVNTLYLLLIHRISVLESITTGDASFAFWKVHGEVIALVTFLGLHADTNHPTYKPSAASETRRRIFAKIFIIDKVVASFTGRPPMLDRNYCSTPMPLDLSDEIMLSDQATLERAVNELDRDGWDLSKRVAWYTPTIIRARMMIAAMKDDIFRIALGPRGKVSIEALLDIKERERELITKFPANLMYHSDDIRDLKLDSPTLYYKMLISLEHLQSVFLIEHLLVQQGWNSHADLLAVSFDMVALTLMFWTHMDRLDGLHGDFEWLVMAYAAPGGGILCMELLRPCLHIQPGRTDITRSSITQQLSLLIGFLDWVSPSAPNGDLCTSCKTIIKNVLDHTLNALSGPCDPAGEPIDWDLSANFGDFFNFDLLDTFSFLQPEMTSGQHCG